MPVLNVGRAYVLAEEEIVIFEDSVAKFLDEHAPPSRVEKWREAGIVERAMWREAGEAGLLCLAVPEAYGGAGGDFRHEVVLMEQAARKEVSGFAVSLHNTIVAPYILHYGSEEQKRKWLPKMASGEFIGAIAMSEPGAGSDLQGIKTSARLEGDHYVVNGQKTFISNGQLADLIIVVAKTGRETEIILASQSKSGVSVAMPVAAGLTAALKGFDVLILDPFVSAHRVTENDNMAIDAVVKTLGRNAGEASVAIELVHHVRKTNGAEITAEDGRGASALIAAARSVRVLNPMSKEEAETAGIGENRRFYFRADIGKANLAPPPTKATWFKLENVALGNGSGGPIDDQDYVGVASGWQWPDAFAGVTVSDLRPVQARIAEGRWRQNAQAKDWVGYAVASLLKLDASNKAHRAKIKAMLKQWIANGALVVVDGEDDKRNKRSFVEVGTPVDE